MTSEDLEFNNLVLKITSQCRIEHEQITRKENADHLHKMKRAMRFWVTLPVGVLCAIFLFLLGITYNSGVKSAEHHTATELILKEQNDKLDRQTMNIGIESKTRKLSDVDLKNQIGALEKKWDENWKWLIEHGNFVHRGINPLVN